MSPSPPDLGVGPFERPRDPSGFPSLPSNAPPVYPGLPIEPGSALPSQGNYRRSGFPSTVIDNDPGTVGPTDYGYQPREATRQTYAEPGEYDGTRHATIQGHSNDAQPAYWRFNQPSSNSGDFAPFPTAPGTSIHGHEDARSFSYVQQEESSRWQPTQQPVRSVSYGHIEGMSSGYDPHAMTFAPDPRHQIPTMHYQPPALDVQGASGLAPAPGPHSAPVQPMHHYGQPSPYMYQHMDQSHPHNASMTAHPAFPPPWYSDPSGLGQMEEESANTEQGQYANRPRRPA